MPSRGRGWVRAGRVAFVVVVAGLVGYLVTVGLSKADKLASAIGAVVALTALVAPYLLPPSVGRSSGGQGRDDDSAAARNAGPAPGGRGEIGGATYTSTFTANDEANQYNAPGGKITINNDRERRR